MLLNVMIIVFVFLVGTLEAAVSRSNTVSWTIGKASSSIDGVASRGPVVFTWTFNKPVRCGVFTDGTPWVVWEPGLELVAVSPEKKTENLLNSGSVISNGITDATCINPDNGELPLDQRMGYESSVEPGAARPWGCGADVWNGSPTALSAGDCIVTGLGRRLDRGLKSSSDENDGSYRRMLYTAIGVCNVVRTDRAGHYRPPIRMPREQRATLLTSKEVPVASLPSFNIPQPKTWSGTDVTLRLSSAIGAVDADDLLNGPVGNCGIYSYLWYETANGMLNHNLSGTTAQGYQRDVSRRFAACLYAAFDPSVDSAKRQRSLNKFIQIGLDYYYMHCLGYPIGNGGGGHPNGIEGAITLAGALLGDAAMTDAIKFQRFKGDAVGQPGKVYDMFSGSMGDFSRSEALHTVSAAKWQSGDFIKRSSKSGAATLADCLPRIDMADPNMVLNCDKVPYVSTVAVDANTSAIVISSAYPWKMYSKNVSSDALRSWRYLPGGVMRMTGDTKIRKILAFKASPGADWTDRTWQGAAGRGGVLLVHPALTAQDFQKLGNTGTLTTGVCTKQEAENDEVVLWESWPVTTLERVHEGFFNTPIQDYLDNKLGDQLYWLPYYHLLDDPAVPGKKLYEESMTYNRIKRFVTMQRDAGSALWNQFTAVTQYSLPDTPVMQALVRHYLLDDSMPSVFCKTYESSDKIWTDSE